MASVDNRVVRMEFDNAQFESRIKQTLASLATLDKALKMEGAKKGLAGVSDAASKVNLNPVQTAVQNVSSGFLALSTIAVTALATITSHAITAGAAVVKGFTLDPILQGFSEYETKIGSIQTILSNTARQGTTLEEVTANLDELNDYADKTIYNFGEMTRNIGLFTNAGIGIADATAMIKGFSNEAAASGTSAEGAASAAYQLSQALSAGTIRLMDWKSLQNVGMGNKNMQNGLIEIADAMGTIEKSGTSAQEVAENFNGTLEKGWLSADVMSTYLKIMAGEMDAAEIAALGLDQATVDMFLKQQQMAEDAATKVRTLTQLMGTIKESIGSSWADTFGLIFGDFEGATALFTGINNAVGGFVQKQGEARNNLLKGWAELGGRNVALQGLEQALFAIGRLLAEVGKAFRDIFPAMTAERLYDLTQRFSEFTASLRPSEKTIENVRRVATGLFSALDIGWDIIKGGIGFIKDLVIQLTGLGSGKYLEGTADILDFFTKLRDSLDGGKKIEEFFDNLTVAVQKPIRFIQDLKDEIFDFFGGVEDTASDVGGAGVDRISQRFETLSSVFERMGALGDVARSALEGIMTVLDTVGEALIGWFQELGDKLSEAMDPGEFDAILDALNVSLLGGIGLLIANFLKGGINFDVGNGLFGNISDAFTQLTGTLEAMQTSIRADALLKIAGAVGILAVSVVALSLIDSASLTRALTAMAVGFAQLMGAFALLNAMNAGISSGATFGIIATGMILLSGAIVVLSAAVAILAQLSWSELLKGLVGVTVLLAGLTAAAILMSKHAPGILMSSVGLVAMAGAIVILTGAVAMLAQMSWSELLKGLGALAVILGVVVAAAVLISKHAAGMLASSVGLSAMGVALNILAGAVAIFGNMSLDELATGIIAIAVVLGLLVAAAIILSKNVAGIMATSVALIALGIALNLIAVAMKSLGGMSWSEIAKGLVAMAGALLILVIAANAMSNALPGAAAMVVMAGAIAILSKVMIELGKVPFGDILKALGGIALALVVLGAAAFLLQPLIPALLGLGLALTLVGAGFALFGAGAYLVARAFQILAEAGPGAADAIVTALEAIGQALPALLTGFAKGILDLIQVFADAAGPIAEALGVLLVHLLETIEEVLPLVGDVFLALIETILEVITEAYPQIIEAGLGLILALITGISENIGPIVEAGLNLIVNFLNGIASGIPQIYTAVGNLIGAFILAAAGFVQQIINAGVQLLINFLLGISNNVSKVVTAVATVIGKFITAVGDLAVFIAAAGTNALVKFLSGMTNNLGKIATAVTTLITSFINAVSAGAQRIITSGANAIIKFVTGIGNAAGRVVTAGVNTVLKFLEGVGSNALRLASGAADMLIQFLNGLATVIREKSPQLREAGVNIAKAIVDGMTGGLASAAGDVIDSATSIASSAIGGVKSVLGIGSPSKVFHEIGQNVVQGFANGLSRHGESDRAADKLANSTVTTVRETIAKVAEEVARMDEIVSPTITPVLDMAKVNAAAADFRQSISDPTMWAVDGGWNNAQVIAKSPNPAATSTGTTTDTKGGVSFEQNIYAPEQLDAAAIYKQTNNQLTLAKEELEVA